MDVFTGGGTPAARIWIEGHPTEGWVPGRVDAVGENGAYLVVDDEGEQFEVPQERARQVDAACLKGVDDLLSLGDFNEGALLHNVRVRYFKDEIYTGIGSPILISVNPFAKLPALYSDEKQKLYREASASTGSGMELPPHLFSVGAASYMAMLNDGKNQSIIISGESGAGKTEATKRILTYFANLQRGSATGTAAARGLVSIEDQVLQSNPILEAFGNAKTVRNDNSSRFGKYIDIEFDMSGKLHSAHISNYLLEKSRIVKQQPDERGYHAFFFLCAGAGSLDIDLGLAGAEAHAYTSGAAILENVDDRSMFHEMVECMDSLGVSGEERNSILEITAAVVHLGDLEFQEYANSADGCRICNVTTAETVCRLLHVSIEDFTKVFRYKTLEDPFTKKIIDMPQDMPSSSNTRHAMAKAIYSRMFDWLVWRVNQSMMKKGDAAKKKEFRKIGILDIYGFEVFDWNSFEQLCINFANEKLQQHFNSHMFTLEQKHYAEEGISWSHIEWQDNRHIIDTLEKRPLGLFCLLDAECVMPSARDSTLLSKIFNNFKNSKVCYKPSKIASTTFAIAHYAGEVIYDIVSFLEKNTDKMHCDISNLLKTSEMPLLKTLFSDSRFAPDAGEKEKGLKRRGSFHRVEKQRQSGTVSQIFRQQLDQLMEDLNKTNPRYIRCIKPNEHKAPQDFNSLDVLRQLCCAGMLESIRIRRSGYSVRRLFKEFYNHFRVLCPQVSTGGRVDPDYKELSRRILMELENRSQREKRPWEAKSWQVGRSKVFMKEELQATLEELLHVAVRGYIVRIQKRWKGFAQRKRYRAMRQAGLLVQTGFRTLRAVMDAKKRRKCAVKIQKVFRGWNCRRLIGRMEESMAAERVQMMRMEEAKREALLAAKRAAAAKEKALEEEQLRHEEEMRLKRLEAEEQEKARQEEERRQERERCEQVQTEIVELRAENARLRGEILALREDSARLQVERSEILELREENSRLQVERVEILSLRKENARLQVEREEILDLRKENARLQAEQEEVLELRKEKARLLVEREEILDLRKDGSRLQEEIQRLREENSRLQAEIIDLRKEKQRERQEMTELSKENARLQKELEEIPVLRKEISRLQLELEEIPALRKENSRLQGERAESLELRKENARLQGELECRAASSCASMAELEQLRQELQVVRQEKMKLEVDMISMKQASEYDALLAEVLKLREECSGLQRAKQESQNQLEACSAQLDAQAARSEQNARQLTSELTALRSAHDELQQQLQHVQAQKAAVQREKTCLEDDIAALRLREQALAEKAQGLEKTVLELQQQQQHMVTMEAELEASKKHVSRLTEQIQQMTKEASASRSEDLDQLRAELLSRIEKRPSIVPSARPSLMPPSARPSMAARPSLLQGENDERKTLVSQRAIFEQLRQQFFDSNCTTGDAADDVSADSVYREAELEEELKQVNKENVELNIKVTHLQSELKDRNWENKCLLESSSTLQAELTELKARMEREASAATRFGAEAADLKSKLVSAEAELAMVRSRLDVTEEQLTNKEEEVRTLQGRTRSLEEETVSLERAKELAAQYMQEFHQAKQLNEEMTKVMADMTQTISERTEEASEMKKQTVMLSMKLDAKAQEVKSAKEERHEAQKVVDSLRSQGLHFQERYQQACEENKTLRQEHSLSIATSTKLYQRVEILQKESYDAQMQLTQVSLMPRTSPEDALLLQQYAERVKDLEMRIRILEEELEASQAFAAKSQAVNDCLNTLLILESGRTTLYEQAFPIVDKALMAQFNDKKLQAQNVVSRLSELMAEEEAA